MLINLLNSMMNDQFNNFCLQSKVFYDIHEKKDRAQFSMENQSQVFQAHHLSSDSACVYHCAAVAYCTRLTSPASRCPQSLLFKVELYCSLPLNCDWHVSPEMKDQVH